MPSMPFLRPKPKVLSDVKTSKTRVFSSLPGRVNLHYSRFLRIRLTARLKVAFIAAAAFYLVFGSVAAPVNHSQLFAAQSEGERKALEEQLAELESQIAEYESTVENYKSQGRTLQSEIDRLDAEIHKLNLKIRSINLSLQKLDQEIKENENGIQSIEESIDLNKSALIKAVRSVYENESASLLLVLLKNSTLSEFFGDINNWFEVQSSLSVTLERIKELRLNLLDEKEALAIKKDDTAALKTYQASQKSALGGAKDDKSTLLKVTKGQESKYQSLLKETQKNAVEIRGRIFQLLGGGELTFERAHDLAKFAEKATGIRAALILAVLDRESALGQNVGKCPYYDAEKNRYYMHPNRDVPVFLEIIEKLKNTGKAPPEPILISCPNRDGLYGGAMGPAQFIPSTWAIYEASISKIAGSSPPNPWNNADAFVGTALYLKDAYNSRSCQNYGEQYDHILPKQTLLERCAAAKYYAGGRWFTYRFVYGDPVVERANRFQQDIDILNS